MTLNKIIYHVFFTSMVLLIEQYNISFLDGKKVESTERTAILMKLCHQSILGPSGHASGAHRTWLRVFLGKGATLKASEVGIGGITSSRSRNLINFLHKGKRLIPLSTHPVCSNLLSYFLIKAN